MKSVDVPRIESLRVKNFRALGDFELTNLTPLTVLLGPNGSGKSTLFDVFEFLSECFSIGLRKAWEKRGRFKEMRTRGQSGPIEIQIEYRESSNSKVFQYRLAIDEDDNGPFISTEALSRLRKNRVDQLHFLTFQDGSGQILVEPTHARLIEEQLSTREVLAVNAFGQLASNPHITALRDFITGWYLSYLNADSTRGVPEAGPQERLSQSGDNLPNVMQFLKERHPETLAEILGSLRTRIPKLESVETKILESGQLLLQLKDGPFQDPIQAKYASDGTLKLLAYLVTLYDPNPPKLIGIEEPENQLHPRLLAGLCEECQKAAERTQLMVTTHSPQFVNSLRPEELWVLYRDQEGLTKARRAADMPGIIEHMNAGGTLGDLWMEGFFDVGDPLKGDGLPGGKSMALTENIEFLVEEESMEAFLGILTHRMIPNIQTRVIQFNGKQALLRNLPNRLKAYSAYLPESSRLVILIDRDADNCTELKRRIKDIVLASGLSLATNGDLKSGQVSIRIAIEELESWFLGDEDAVLQAYPRVKAFAKKEKYRNPDAVRGGTHETFWKLLSDNGYFPNGLRKTESLAPWHL